MKNILIKNINVLNGHEDMTPFISDILISGNRIEKIAQNIESKDCLVIDGTGKYIIPGLINLHVHLPANGAAPFKNSNSKKLVKLIVNFKPFHKIGINLGKKNALMDLKSGVTTVRAVGGVANFDTILRDQINSGKVLGPRLFVANNALSVKNGHMAGTVTIECETKEDFSREIDRLVKENVDLIKIMITGGVTDGTTRGEPGIMRMNEEQVKLCCDEAHKRGLKVAAHVESNEGVKVAVKCGVDTIEHGGDLSEEDIELVRKNNAAYVITLSPAMPLSMLTEEETGVDETAQYNTYIVIKNIIGGTEKLLKAGLPVGLGTDTGSPFVTHYNFYRELVWYEKLFGVSRAFALYTGTLLNAKILGFDGEIGSIDEGKLADLVILENNPLDDLLALKNPKMVMKDGAFVQNLDIKKNQYLDDCLDKIMDIDFKKLLHEKFEK